MNSSETIRAKFKSYCKGRDELAWWKSSLESAYNAGKKINKTKYQKICSLYKDRKQRAEELLDELNRSHPRYIECMPPSLPRPPKRDKHLLI